MTSRLHRRNFLKAAGTSASWAASLPAWAQRKRNVKIGHTGITWVQAPPPRPPATDAAPGAPPAPPAARGGPRRIDPAYIEGIFKDVSSLGYYGLELFTYQIQGMEANGGIGPFIEKYN